jgi:hypothetical protein
MTADLRVQVRWAGGGEARVLRIGADAIALDSSVPSPPGSRIEGTLEGGAGAAARLRVKVHASKRQPDGRFVLEGRPLDLSRATREGIEAGLRG